MKELKEMKELLVRYTQPRFSDLSEVDTKEMGEVIDMIKDLAEASYYCAITKAMEQKDEEERYQKNYPSMYNQQAYYPMDEREMDRNYGRMYYSGGNSSSSSNSSGGNNARGGGGRGYSEMSYPMHGDYNSVGMSRSELSRRSYMEAKNTHQKDRQMSELNNYMQELSNDLSEIIQDASPEEKTMLQQKINTLASKIQK